MNDPAWRLESVLAVGSDDSRRDCGQLIEAFARRVTWVHDTAQALELISQQDWELVLLASSVPQEDASGLALRLSGTPGAPPLVAVAAQPNVNLAVRLVRQGVYDVIPGPLDRPRLQQLVAGLRQDRGDLAQRRERYFRPDCPPSVPMVGRSEAMARVLELVRLISESSCNPVLILGETGAGKELAARAVHAWRNGGEERFVDVNCAALTASLLESELFGHVRGSFTGADRDKTGLFELAGAGTLLLDEISEMPSELQAKLLRVLQERTFRKVGGTSDVRCEATIIATSNRPLLQDVKEGKFRGDLYYRLAVFPIMIPPLRDPQRRQDIPLLAEYFIENSCIVGRSATGLSDQAWQRLLEHDWPGNIRELRNVIDRALILERSEQVGLQSLVIEPAAAPAVQPAASDTLVEQPTAVDPNRFSLETAEREFIMRALKETGWQRTRAAALLGITRATLHAKLKRYGIRPPEGLAGQEQPDLDVQVESPAP